MVIERKILNTPEWTPLEVREVDNWVQEDSIILNRLWVYEDQQNDEHPSYELNFVVPHSWFAQMYDSLLAADAEVELPDDMEYFLEAYDPEHEGQFFYELAKSEDIILDEYFIRTAAASLGVIR